VCLDAAPMSLGGEQTAGPILHTPISLDAWTGEVSGFVTRLDRNDTGEPLTHGASLAVPPSTPPSRSSPIERGKKQLSGFSP